MMGCWDDELDDTRGPMRRPLSVNGRSNEVDGEGARPQAFNPTEMSGYKMGVPNSAPKRRFAGSEYALMRYLAQESVAQGNMRVAPGYVELALEIGTTTRTVERAVACLVREGYLRVLRRGRAGNSVLTLTETAMSIFGLRVTRQAPSASEPSRAPALHVTSVPAGFIGDVKAYEVALILSKADIANGDHHGFAMRYMLNIEATAEEVRLEQMLDDERLLPTVDPITGDARLDEGLRLYYQRQRSRRSALDASRVLVNSLEARLKKAQLTDLD